MAEKEKSPVQKKANSLVEKKSSVRSVKVSKEKAVLKKVEGKEVEIPRKKVKNSVVLKGYCSRMKSFYRDKVITLLVKEFGYTSVMAVPSFDKIVVNMGVGAGVSDKNVVDSALSDLTTLAGQKAVKMLARKSVSNFKLRQGMPIGAKVTLRGDRMFDFLDKLISVALPRVRDFRGMRVTGFDGRGNFSFGISEQIVFPEINYDKIDRVRGMDVTIVTTATTDTEAKSLLTHFGFPFRK